MADGAERLGARAARRSRCRPATEAGSVDLPGGRGSEVRGLVRGPDGAWGRSESATGWEQSRREGWQWIEAGRPG